MLHKCYRRGICLRNIGLNTKDMFFFSFLSFLLLFPPTPPPPSPRMALRSVSWSCTHLVSSCSHPHILLPYANFWYFAIRLHPSATFLPIPWVSTGSSSFETSIQNSFRVPVVERHNHTSSPLQSFITQVGVFIQSTELFVSPHSPVSYTTFIIHIFSSDIITVITFKIITIARCEQNIFEIGHSYGCLRDIFKRIRTH